jgi:hypothetical protein
MPAKARKSGENRGARATAPVSGRKSTRDNHMMSPNQKSAKNDKLEKCCFPAETLDFFGFNVDFQKLLTTDSGLATKRARAHALIVWPTG